jgi:hypothetical protein
MPKLRILDLSIINFLIIVNNNLESIESLQYLKMPNLYRL